MPNPVKLGAAIPLVLQLTDEDSAAFPQVILRDAGGSLVGSPIDLAHVALGLYKDESEVMPATDRIFAQYKVYSDAGHTTEHPIHCDTIIEVFERDYAAEAIDSIYAIIQGFTGSFDQLEGIIDDDPGLLVGAIDDIEFLSGTIENDDYLVGTIEEDILTGQLYDEGELTGVIEC